MSLTAAYRWLFHDPIGLQWLSWSMLAVSLFSLVVSVLALAVARRSGRGS